MRGIGLQPSIVVLLLALGACQEPHDAALSDDDRSAVVATVDSATRAFEEAERSQDAEQVVAHLAPDFYMYANGERLGYDSVVAGIRRTLGSFEHWEPGFANIEVRVLGPDAALVSMTFRDSITTASGETVRARGPTTLLWQRRGRRWLITYADADHYPVEE